MYIHRIRPQVKKKFDDIRSNDVQDNTGYVTSF